MEYFYTIKYKPTSKPFRRMSIGDWYDDRASVFNNVSGKHPLCPFCGCHYIDGKTNNFECGFNGLITYPFSTITSVCENYNNRKSKVMWPILTNANGVALKVECILDADGNIIDNLDDNSKEIELLNNIQMLTDIEEKNKFPTIAELEKLLNSKDRRDIEIQPDGSIKVIEPVKIISKEHKCTCSSHVLFDQGCICGGT